MLLVDGIPPVYRWYNAELLGAPAKAWLAGAAAVGLAFAVGIGAVLWSRRKAVPNPEQLLAEYLPRSPEAALMIMPPAIPSYLAYRYAIKRMHPQDADLVEQWRDYVPSDEPDWEGDWEQDFE